MCSIRAYGYREWKMMSARINNLSVSLAINLFVKTSDVYVKININLNIKFHSIIFSGNSITDCIIVLLGGNNFSDSSDVRVCTSCYSILKITRVVESITT